MKYIIIILFAILQPCLCYAQKVWTLDECMEYAMSHNTEISKRLIEKTRKEQKLRSSKDAKLPTVSSNISQDYSSGVNNSTGMLMTGNLLLTKVGIKASMPLYTGSKLTSQIKSDKFSLMAATEDLKNSSKNLRINVASHYLQVLYDKSEVEVLKKKVELSQSLLEKAKAFVNVGKSPESEVATAEALLSTDKADLIVAESNATLSLLDLVQLLNLPSIEDFDVCEPKELNYELLDDTESLYMEVEKTYPTILRAQYNVQKAKHDIRVARSGYYPNLDLEVSLQEFYYKILGEQSSPSFRDQIKTNYQALVGLKLTIPIFNAFQTRNNIRNAKTALADANVALIDAQLNLRKDIQQAYYKALTAKDKYEASVKSEKSNAISYEYLERKYSVGRASLYDLNQSKQQWFSSKESAIRAKYELIIRMKILELYKENNYEYVK